MGRCSFGPSLLLSLFLVAPAWALETDQFTVPSAPLVDLAPQLRQHLVAALQEVVVRGNEAHAHYRELAGRSSGAMAKAYERRAAECLTPDYAARALYDLTGHGLPECTIESWVRFGRFPQQPAKFEIACSDSVYGNLFQRPLTMQELSPTINVYGVYFGTDKIGHLFQQGHEYYEIYRREEDRGRRPAEATRKAVELGTWQERGFFGEAMVGVYSNADLAANFAGLKFYLNLTRPLVFNGRQLPPMLVQRWGRWEMNDAAGDDFLRPFITEHLNEALNASRYIWLIRGTVRQRMRDRGASWIAFHHATRDAEAQTARRLSTWYGEDYGHSGFEHVMTLADTIFAPPPTIASNDER